MLVKKLDSQLVAALIKLGFHVTDDKETAEVRDIKLELMHPIDKDHLLLTITMLDGRWFTCNVKPSAIVSALDEYEQDDDEEGDDEGDDAA